jgi:glycosyltransferase involved in cell wall biosynthesis
MSSLVPPAGTRILFVINNPDFFISHRLPLGIGARESGYEVHIAAPEGAGADRLRTMGFHYHPIPLSRSGASPFGELRSMFALLRLYREVRPQVVHHVTIKPVLYGTLAARIVGVPSVVNAFSGLGFIFIQGGWFARFRRFLVTSAYRLFLRHCRQIAIFQNGDDRDMAIAGGWVSRRNVVLIRGSGVDLELFQASPEVPGPLLVVFPARLLRDKGIREFAEAARRLHRGGEDFGPVRFALVGAPDPGNPASVSADWVADRVREGVLEAWGHREDMERVFAECHVVCLPSYREGLPKALIEAAACGRPIVTTDVPGCREVIRNGEGGYLVPPQDAEALVLALERLLKDGQLRGEMGRRNREEAERSFGIRGVVRATLDIYADLVRQMEESR